MIILPPSRPNRVFRLEEFNTHSKIGIDFDGTLVQHQYSEHLQRYILKNHQFKHFHIITFRSHGMQDQIRQDLMESIDTTGVRLSLNHFVSVHNIPDETYRDHLERLTANDYYAWKAVKCAELGITILIDDLADWLHEHCVKHGVDLVSPDDLDIA